MLCKVTLGVLKGASKLNVLLLLLYKDPPRAISMNQNGPS